MYISKALVQNLRQRIINHISQVKMESKMVGLMGWGVQEQGWRKGPWTPEEDKLLTEYVSLHGEGKWSSVARSAGLNRNGKSCRLRWVNYLRPGLKRSQLTPQEEGIIIELHAIWGNKWSTIARYLPGRTDNEIKNYWRTHFRKKGMPSQKQQKRKTQLLLQQQQQLEDQKNHDDTIKYKVPLPHDHPEVGDKKIINEKSSQGNYQLETVAPYPSMEEYSHLPVMCQDVSSFWSDTNNPTDDEILWGGLWNLDGVPNSRLDQSSGSSKIAIQNQANAYFCGESSIN